MSRFKPALVALVLSLTGVCAEAATLQPREDVATTPAQEDAAIVNFRQVLANANRQEDPQGWAGAHVHLGAWLGVKAERLPGDAGLDMIGEAIDHFGQALAVYDRRADNWVVVQKNLSNARLAQARRLTGAGRVQALRKAAAIDRDIITVQTFETATGDWAEDQLHLAKVLLLLAPEMAEAGRNAAYTEVVTGARGAAKIFSRDSTPEEWSTLQDALGTALRGLGGTADPRGDLMQQSVEAYTQALKVRTRKAMPAEWAQTSVGLATTEAALAEARRDPALMRTALKRMDDALPVLKGGEAETAKAARAKMQVSLAGLAAKS